MAKRVLMATATVLALGVFGVSAASAATLTVCESGPPTCGYAHIQEAVNAAVSGDTIDIAAGTYILGRGELEIEKNLTLQGAGMWYVTLTGDPALYTNSSRRVTLNGSGSNIHLSDLSIVGKLNYRNDNEPNDGLGGTYGTGSTISN